MFHDAAGYSVCVGGGACACEFVYENTYPKELHLSGIALT